MQTQQRSGTHFRKDRAAEIDCVRLRFCVGYLATEDGGDILSDVLYHDLLSLKGVCEAFGLHYDSLIGSHCCRGTPVAIV